MEKVSWGNRRKRNLQGKMLSSTDRIFEPWFHFVLFDMICSVTNNLTSRRYFQYIWVALIVFYDKSSVDLSLDSSQKIFSRQKYRGRIAYCSNTTWHAWLTASSTNKKESCCFIYSIGGYDIFRLHLEWKIDSRAIDFHLLISYLDLLSNAIFLINSWDDIDSPLFFAPDKHSHELYIEI